ncbi:glycosyltransferase 61 family protein [Oecophyllibacter saccharovorans]|uniref:glycosyltransferase 61 family protein n=1 Tax=Oecophyllibacter saccharovorans TaxID=2558360 RepID=UPI00116F94B7|nr:glycosyltransferase 61 family protein [Oecophyllibacter saccharovorans]TPW33698.1 DUF563 domain-containing protein [Oecophyllibacter saccharovorans]
MFDFDSTSLHDWKVKTLGVLFQSAASETTVAYQSHLDALRSYERGRDHDVLRELGSISAEHLLHLQSKREHLFWAKVYYVCTREFGSGWTDLLSLLPRSFISPGNGHYPLCLEESLTDSAIPPRIIQCRPDKPLFSPSSCQQVTWAQKNPLLSYDCYDDEKSRRYLMDHFGTHFTNAYQKVGYAAGQADLTALSVLYWEGGIFADVFSACRASISQLIDSKSRLILFSDKNRVDKFFIASAPRHPHIGRLLQRAIKLTEYGMYNVSHDKFTDHLAWTLSILDAVCENPHYLKDNGISFLSREIYDCAIEFNGQDEDISHHEQTRHFVTLPASALISTEERLKLFSTPGSNAVLGKVDAYILPAAIPLTIVGRDHHPDWSERQRHNTITPAAHVYEWNMVGLSGHCCLWKDESFIRLDSYLSHVAEIESRSGHWKPPSRDLVTRVVDEPVIPAFSAGYGCYGHYIVDDLPRLGLIRKILGAAEFDKLKIIMPVKTPAWAFDLLKIFFEIEKDRIILFDHERDFWILRRSIVSEYLHRNYVFNPFIKEFYQGYFQEESVPTRRICLSRKAWESGKTHQRVFRQQEWFENEAQKRGFEIISPERLSIPEQIRLMCQTKIQIGEHGSAQHASIYSKFGMTVGTINPLGDVQINLGRLSGNRNVIVYETEHFIDEKANTFFDCSKSDLLAFFDHLE